MHRQQWAEHARLLPAVGDDPADAGSRLFPVAVRLAEGRLLQPGQPESIASPRGTRSGLPSPAAAGWRKSLPIFTLSHSRPWPCARKANSVCIPCRWAWRVWRYTPTATSSRWS